MPKVDVKEMWLARALEDYRIRQGWTLQRLADHLNGSYPELGATKTSVREWCRGLQWPTGQRMGIILEAIGGDLTRALPGYDPIADGTFIKEEHVTRLLSRVEALEALCDTITFLNNTKNVSTEELKVLQSSLSNAVKNAAPEVAGKAPKHLPSEEGDRKEKFKVLLQDVLPPGLYIVAGKVFEDGKTKTYYKWDNLGVCLVSARTLVTITYSVSKVDDELNRLLVWHPKCGTLRAIGNTLEFMEEFVLHYGIKGAGSEHQPILDATVRIRATSVPGYFLGWFRTWTGATTDREGAIGPERFALVQFFACSPLGMIPLREFDTTDFKLTWPDEDSISEIIRDDAESARMALKAHSLSHPESLINLSEKKRTLWSLLVPTVKNVIQEAFPEGSEEALLAGNSVLEVPDLGAKIGQTMSGPFGERSASNPIVCADSEPLIEKGLRVRTVYVFRPKLSDPGSEAVAGIVLFLYDREDLTERIAYFGSDVEWEPEFELVSRQRYSTSLFRESYRVRDPYAADHQRSEEVPFTSWVVDALIMPKRDILHILYVDRFLQGGERKTLLRTTPSFNESLAPNYLDNEFEMPTGFQVAFEETIPASEMRSLQDLLSERIKELGGRSDRWRIALSEQFRELMIETCSLPSEEVEFHIQQLKNAFVRLASKAEQYTQMSVIFKSGACKALPFIPKNRAQYSTLNDGESSGLLRLRS